MAKIRLRISHDQDCQARHTVEKITKNAQGQTFISQYQLKETEIKSLLKHLGPNVTVEHIASSASANTLSTNAVVSLTEAAMQPPQMNDTWQSQFNQVHNGHVSAHPEFGPNSLSPHTAYKQTHTMKYGPSPPRGGGSGGGSDGAIATAASSASAMPVRGYDAASDMSCYGNYSTVPSSSGPPVQPGSQEYIDRTRARAQRPSACATSQ